MRTWFTNYPGSRWDERLARANFTDSKDPNDHHTFASVIRDVRKRFYLKKTNTIGKEVGTGIPRIFDDLGKNHDSVQVYVDAFQWGNFVEVDGSMQPLLRLKMRMFTSPKPQMSRRRTSLSAPEKIMEYWVDIRFDPQWPNKPPHVRIDDPQYRRFSGSAHAHHMFENGWVCFFADSGDWTPSDTIISFTQAFFGWALWHYQKFNW